MRDIKEVADQVVAELGSWWEEEAGKAEVAEAVTAPLYHYTDAAGLKGIIEHQQLWFTSVLHQNDPTELEHGIRLAFSEFDEIALNLQTQGGGLDYVFRELRNIMLTRMTPVQLPIEFFVASFSEDDDEL